MNKEKFSIEEVALLLGIGSTGWKEYQPDGNIIGRLEYHPTPEQLAEAKELLTPDAYEILARSASKR